MKKKSSKQNKIIPIILGIIIIIGAFIGIKEYIYFSKHIDTDDAQIDADISPVIARVGGYVDSIYFEENTAVKANQVVVKLDDRDYKIKLEQALAGIKSVQANINVGESVISSTTIGLGSASANVDAAKARATKANQDFIRFQNLIKDGSITQQQFDYAKAEKIAADAQLEAAKNQYEVVKKQIGTSQSQLSATQTGLAQHHADIDFARLQLSYTDIKAPATGIASKKNVQIGQLVQPGQALFSIVNEGSLYVTANFKETQVEKLKEGQEVEVIVDAFPDITLKGEVYNFSPATGAKFALLPPDNATGNFVKVIQRIPVKIKIDQTNKIIEKLRPGMSVKVSVHVG